MKPIASVIICTYNRCESLEDTLQALMLQKLDSATHMELIVVNNNSKDETFKVVQNAAEVAPFPIKHVFEGKQGISYARNRGIAEAEGELILFTDDDTMPDKKWAFSLVNGFEKYEADCVGGKILPYWLSEPPAWLHDNEVLLGNLAMLDRGNNPIIAETFDANLIYGANMAFRKKDLIEAGLFNTELGCTGKITLRGEDIDMIERLVELGKRVVYIPNAVVMHKVESQRLNKSYFRSLRFNSGRTQIRMEKERWLKLPRWLLRQCVTNGFKSIGKYLRGIDFEATRDEMLFWFQLGQIKEIMCRKETKS